MRTLVGIAVDGQVTEMSLPDGVPLAHLVPEVLALVGAGDGRRSPRRIDGEWLDLERSLAQQEWGPGRVICLEEREAHGGASRHDPVMEIVERGPPVDLVSGRAAGAVMGGFVGAWLAANAAWGAPVVIAVAPVVWALLPLFGGMATGSRIPRIRGLLELVSTGAGAAALAASGPVAMLGPAGVGLDGCLAAAVLVHVGRRRWRNALLRVAFGAAEWWLLGAVLPLTVVVAGWSGW